MITGDKRVMDFIHNFTTLFSSLQPNETEVIVDVFSHGYCYYFAHMLKEAFGCGEIYMTADDRHIVWMYKNIAYDINGVYNAYPKSANNGNFYNGELIPIAMLPNYMESFKHVVPGTTKKGMAERRAVKKIMDVQKDIRDMKKIDSFIEEEIKLRCMNDRALKDNKKF